MKKKMHFVYVFVSPSKNITMNYRDIDDFREEKHGIYFLDRHGVRQFVNWNNIGTYSLFLTEEDENDT